MAAAAPKKQFALDSNVIFDLAEEKDFAHTFREVSAERGYALRIPPTVIQELTHLALVKHCDETPMALKALRKMREWQLTPFDLSPVGHAITERFSIKLIETGLLPEGEENDGFILAETALAEIPVLVSSDRHLVDIDPARLILQFKESDLTPVMVAHPKRLLRAMSA